MNMEKYSKQVPPYTMSDEERFAAHQRESDIGKKWRTATIIFVVALTALTMGVGIAVSIANTPKEACNEKIPEPTGVRVHYWLWKDPNPSIETESRRVSLITPNASVFSSVMEEASALTSGYEFEYIQYDFGRYITSIGGVKENIEKNLYWGIFKLGAQPDVNKPPSEDLLLQVGVDDLTVQNNDIYLYWLRHYEWSGTDTMLEKRSEFAHIHQ